MPKTDDATPPAPNTSWRDDTSAMRAVSAAVARHAARDAKRGAKGLWARWRADPAGHAVTALTTVLILAVFVLAQSARASIPASADIGPPALTRAAEMRATAVAVDTPEPTPGAQTGAAPADLLPAVARWWPQIVKAATAHGIPPRLFACLVTAESSGDSLAQSNFQYQDPVTGAWRTEHAYGLAQIAWVYHTDYDIARGKADPAYNLDYGAAYLAELLADTGGDMATALHRYNGNGRYNGYVAGINRCDERGA